MRNTFIKTLTEIAKEDYRVMLLTADMGFSVFENFRDLFPERFINVGICEQNLVGLSAGLALSGKKPYIYSIVPFITMRCYEQIRNDLCYQNLNVKIVGVGSGFSYGPTGMTHHAIEDIAIMRALPNMKIICPGDPIEVKKLMKESSTVNGPVYIRLAKNGEPIINPVDAEIYFGKANTLFSGKDLTIFSTGNMLETSKNLAERLNREDISTKLVSMHTIKPLDVVEIERSIRETPYIVSIEEHSIIGGLGSAIAEVIAESTYDKKVKFKRIGIRDIYPQLAGNQNYLRKTTSIDEEAIYHNIVEELK